jgi:glycerol-3-phosphate dehydrogenase
MENRSELLRPRADLLSQARNEPCFDVAIVGGGIHGAACARFAAANGLKTILLEKADYAAGTSSRSSKMAHGGLRYLEMFDFEQVFEGIKAREEMFEAAPHIVSPTRFLIPIPKGACFFKLKLGVGLFLYDLMVRDKRRKHKFLRAGDLGGTGFAERRNDLAGCFSYTDGLLNDGLLTLDYVLAARQHGAVCLNYAGVSQIDESATGVDLRCSDEISGDTFSVRASTVLNCAGPWAPFLLNEGDRPAVRFSRGTHLIFNRPWDGPSLFLPMEGKARYYFVWPHAAGTMVGTTERETDSLELDPLPGSDEVEEILARLKKDLPLSGLDRSSLHYAFAGVRTLPLRPNSKAGTTRLSRKHIWHGGGRVLTLVGGKLTTAAWTAEEGVAKALKLVRPEQSFRSTRGERLPRATVPPLILERFRVEARGAGLSAQEIERLVSRYGLDIERLRAPDLKRIGEFAFEGEVKIALDIEQAEHLEDIMRRRLNLEYMPGNGAGELGAIAQVVAEHRSPRAFDSEVVAYRSRITQLLEILRGQQNLPPADPKQRAVGFK